MEVQKKCQDVFTHPIILDDVPPKFNLFLQRAHLIESSLKEMKLWKFPEIEGYFLKNSPPLWPTYIGKKRTTFAKACGIKLRCHGEHVGEHIKNPLRSPPCQNLKDKKSRACLGLPIGCMTFLFPDQLVTILGLGLQRTPLPIKLKRC
jgi:hypothetical protein